jgi:hypothetical protein
MKLPISDAAYSKMLKVHVLWCATDVSRPKIRKILEIAREIEQNQQLQKFSERRKRKNAVKAELLGVGGCVVYRPAVWCPAEPSGTNNG